MMEELNENKEFWAECNVCGTQHKNWVGSTPCCGSIAFIVGEDGKKTEDVPLYAVVNGRPMATTLKVKANDNRRDGE